MGEKTWKEALAELLGEVTGLVADAREYLQSAIEQEKVAAQEARDRAARQRGAL